MLRATFISQLVVGIILFVTGIAGQYSNSVDGKWAMVVIWFLLTVIACSIMASAINRLWNINNK